MEGMSSNNPRPKMRRVARSTLVVLTANLAPLRAAVADVARLTVVAESVSFKTAACQVGWEQERKKHAVPAHLKRYADQLVLYK